MKKKGYSYAQHGQNLKFLRNLWIFFPFKQSVKIKKKKKYFTNMVVGIEKGKSSSISRFLKPVLREASDLSSLYLGDCSD